MSLNRVTIMGRLSNNLEIRRTQNGTAVASFTLAVDGNIKDKQTRKAPTNWIDCVAWSHIAEFMAQYLYEKGRMVVVDGRLQTRTWQDKDGNNRKSTEVIAENVYFGDSKPKGDAEDHKQLSYTPEPYGRMEQPQNAPLEEDEGELPF